MVGDSIDDMLAGYYAGAGTVLIRSHANTGLDTIPETDCAIDR